MAKVWLLLGAALLCALAGCDNVVQSNVTSFHQLADQSVAGKKLAIRAYPEGRESSLEFGTYRSILAGKFAEKGFVVVERPQDADWIAIVSYGIGDGKPTTNVISSPVYGQTGGGTTYYSGTAYTASGPRPVSGSFYSMPTYGQVGTTTTSYSTMTYQRSIAIDIVDRASLAGGSPKTLYETRIVSSGRCASMAAVFSPMVDALFQDWPGPSGKSRPVEIYTKNDC
jgi:hypothetical protein